MSIPNILCNTFSKMFDVSLYDLTIKDEWEGEFWIQQGSNYRASTNYIAPVLQVSDDPVEPAVNFLSSALRLLLEPNNIPARTANAPAAIPYMNISSVIFSLSNMPS